MATDNETARRARRASRGMTDDKIEEIAAKCASACRHEMFPSTATFETRIEKVLRAELRELLASCSRTPVGGGDGDTYAVTGPTFEAMRNARAALSGDHD